MNFGLVLGPLINLQRRSIRAGATKNVIGMRRRTLRVYPSGWEMVLRVACNARRTGAELAGKGFVLSRET